MNYTELHIFDFDGTLFRSPTNTPQNQAKYEKITGIPWIVSKEKSRELSKKLGKFVGMRSGWFGRPETLEPPLVADPAPSEWFIQEACEALIQSKANSEALTVILTGRHSGLKGQVLRICDQGNLVKVQNKKSKEGKSFYDVIDPNVICHFLGDSGPKPTENKPNETLPWKLWIIEQYISIYPSINKIIFWEDREEHVENFKSLHGTLVEEVIVNHVV